MCVCATCIMKRNVYVEYSRVGRQGSLVPNPFFLHESQSALLGNVSIRDMGGGWV